LLLVIHLWSVCHTIKIDRMLFERLGLPFRKIFSCSNGCCYLFGKTFIHSNGWGYPFENKSSHLNGCCYLFEKIFTCSNGRGYLFGKNAQPFEWLLQSVHKKNINCSDLQDADDLRSWRTICPRCNIARTLWCLLSSCF